ncbi:MAG TPA: hypothetical protein VEB64_00620 [Azospirillaceae bacterium]|nr:hypothetical protein [Azospirillaceae bacterium]
MAKVHEQLRLESFDAVLAARHRRRRLRTVPGGFVRTTRDP